MSTAQAWSVGRAPELGRGARKIFDWVDSWTWVSMPITTS